MFQIIGRNVPGRNVPGRNVPGRKVLEPSKLCKKNNKRLLSVGDRTQNLRDAILRLLPGIDDHY